MIISMANGQRPCSTERSTSTISRTDGGIPPWATCSSFNFDSRVSAASFHCDPACARRSSPGNCGSSLEYAAASFVALALLSVAGAMPASGNCQRHPNSYHRETAPVRRRRTGRRALRQSLFLTPKTTRTTAVKYSEVRTYIHTVLTYWCESKAPGERVAVLPHYWASSPHAFTTHAADLGASLPIERTLVPHAAGLRVLLLSAQTLVPHAAVFGAPLLSERMPVPHAASLMHSWLLCSSVVPSPPSKPMLPSVSSARMLPSEPLLSVDAAERVERARVERAADAESCAAQRRAVRIRPIHVRLCGARNDSACAIGRDRRTRGSRGQSGGGTLKLAGHRCHARRLHINHRPAHRLHCAVRFATHCVVRVPFVSKPWCRRHRAVLPEHRARPAREYSASTLGNERGRLAQPSPFRRLAPPCRHCGLEPHWL